MAYLLGRRLVSRKSQVQTVICEFGQNERRLSFWIILLSISLIRLVFILFSLLIPMIHIRIKYTLLFLISSYMIVYGQTCTFLFYDQM